MDTGQDQGGVDTLLGVETLLIGGNPNLRFSSGRPMEYAVSAGPGTLVAYGIAHVNVFQDEALGFALRNMAAEKTYVVAPAGLDCETGR